MNKIVSDVEENEGVTSDDENEDYYDESARQSILVDPEHGPFYTLEDALDQCEPFTTIFLTEGVYTCCIEINKVGIIVEKRDIEKKVYILGNEGPVIRVNIDNDAGS